MERCLPGYRNSFVGGNWKLNQNAVQKKFDPMIDEIEEAINVLKNDKK